MITTNFLQFLFNLILANALLTFLALKLSGTDIGKAIALIR